MSPRSPRLVEARLRRRPGGPEDRSESREDEDGARAGEDEEGPEAVTTLKELVARGAALEANQADYRA
ncbi:hypothetical protein KCW65_24020, partial [Mycobacterium tuberculosis]|nr:hypothetical protein [Mycobacterium tuberculosis]